MKTKGFETAVIRRWEGKWEGTAEWSEIAAGGFVITFHEGFETLKAEHYDTIQEIKTRYPRYAWMLPMPGDTADVVLVGI